MPGTKLSETAVLSDTSKTFVFLNEGHTLGNALRHVAAQHPNTEFAGYTVPHPSDPKMNLRLQTRKVAGSSSAVAANDVLRETAQTLKSMCEHIKASFGQSNAEFDGSK